MKKTFYIGLLMASMCLTMGLSHSVLAAKVYPKANTSKGLAPNLYLPDNPSPAVIKINEAKQAWFEERYKDACQLWREALTKSPKHPEGIWHDIGSCSMKIEAYNDAVAAYTNSIRLSSKKSASAYYERGKAYIKTKDIANAEKDFLTSISLDEHYTDSYHQMMYIEENRNNFEKALFYADKTVENAPKYASGIENRAYILHMLDRNKEAKEFLLENKDIVMSDDRIPDKSYFYNLLGEIYKSLKEYNMAITYYEKALDFNPQHHYAEINICRVYIDLNKGEEAIQHCLKGVDIFPHWNGFFTLSHAFAIAKQYDKGLRVCQFMLENEVFHPNTYKYCAMNKAGLGDISGALEDIEKAKEEVNKWEPEEVNVGEAQFRLGKKEEALKDIDKLAQDIKNRKYDH